MANRPNRFIKLSEEENENLRTLEQNPHIHAKVRLRTQILRLSHGGVSMQGIGQYVGKSYDMVKSTFTRWETESYAGLADHFENQGQKPKLTEELKTFMAAKLKEERTWTCDQLSAAILESYGVKVGPEGVRLRLREMGYSWKRGRFVPSKRPGEDDLKPHRAALASLKRGHSEDA
jgi:transposase